MNQTPRQRTLNIKVLLHPCNNKCTLYISQIAIDKRITVSYYYLLDVGLNLKDSILTSKSPPPSPRFMALNIKPTS